MKNSTKTILSGFFLVTLLQCSISICAQEPVMDDESEEFEEYNTYEDPNAYEEDTLLESQENPEIMPPAASNPELPQRPELLTGVFYAPYEGPFPVSIESRFDGFFSSSRNATVLFGGKSWPVAEAITRAAFLDNLFTFSGFVKLPHFFFFKLGTVIGGGCDIVRRVGVDLQFGKYWPCWGAVRVGLFANEIGIGADYWAIYRNRFKWLTTLEIAAFKDQHYFGQDKLRPSIKWLNRFFIIGDVYISAGVEHINGLRNCRNLTQGFLGFGSAI